MAVPVRRLAPTTPLDALLFALAKSQRHQRDVMTGAAVLLIDETLRAGVAAGIISDEQLAQLLELATAGGALLGPVRRT
jgi:hypothetical protein